MSTPARSSCSPGWTKEGADADASLAAQTPEQSAIEMMGTAAR